MDVFLVPVAPDRYDLYCEEPDEPEPPAVEGTPPPGFFRRMALRFREQLAEAERARRQGRSRETCVRPSSAASRRGRCGGSRSPSRNSGSSGSSAARTPCCSFIPDDVTEAQARQLLKRSLQRDWERHRFWLVIDSLVGAGSVLLILLPGPNFIGYYFMFRIVGHYFSLRGARRGLTGVTWTGAGQRPALPAADDDPRGAGGPRRARARRRRGARTGAPRVVLPAHRDAVASA